MLLAELYYANLGKTHHKSTMRVAAYRFQPIEKYLDRAIRRMEREDIQVKMRWEEVKNDEPEPSKADEESQQENQDVGTGDEEIEQEDIENTHGVPIFIYPISENVSDKTVENFMSSHFLLDSPGRRSSKTSIMVHDSDPSERIIWVNRLPNNEFLYQLPDSLTLKRQLHALRYLLNSPRREYHPLLSLIESEKFVQWPKFQKSEDIEWEILTDEKRDGIDAQRNFVEIALADEDTGTPDFAVLDGPPGSGKTTAICELILQAIQRNQKVLLCASTHIAVDNVLERLQDHDEIIPIRITNSVKNVKDSLRKYTLQRCLQTEKDSIISFLQSRGKNSLESQDFLLRSLEEDDQGNVITQLILDSANLICGTTIGFLRHPDINANQPPRPVFDLMILDEASKTTFQEFLVPALFAKRWVLSGDIRQLSPYVEEKEVEGNIEYLLGRYGREDGELCLNVHKAAGLWGPKNTTMHRPNNRESGTQRSPLRSKKLLFISEPSDPSLDKCMKQCEKEGLDTVLVTEDTFQDQLQHFKILGADAFLVESTILSQVEPYLPPDLQIIHLNHDVELKNFTRRAWYWRKQNNLVKSTNISLEELRKERDPSSWAYELTWRIIRQYELRRTPEEQEYLSKQIEKLIPAWFSEDRKTSFLSQLDNIKQIALPSCLELLQEGFKKSKKDIEFEKQKGIKIDYALACGLPSRVFQARHVMLEYQHRMHPDISQFPRDHIYSDQRTKEPVALLDPAYIEKERQWNYDKFNHRRWWCHVKQLYGNNKFQNKTQKGNKKYSLRKSNVNLEEADRIMDELDQFRAWTTTHPKKLEQKSDSRCWTVAILTFYRGQERELSHRLRKYFKKRNFRYFNDTKHNIKVEICTVDRFQGHEADVVFLSFVRNGYSIGFLNSVHRLNVAITRSRFLLVIFGDQLSFKKAYGKKHNSDVLYYLATTTLSDLKIW